MMQNARQPKRARWKAWRSNPSATPDANPGMLSGQEDIPHRPIDWALVKRLLQLLAPRKKRYALGISLGLGMVTLEMLSPQFIQRIIDLIGSALQVDSASAIRAASWSLLAIILLWSAVWVVALLLQRATILIMTDAGERVQFDLRRAMFDQLQRLSMSFYDKTKLGRIVSRCTSDLSAMREINVWGLDTVCKNSLMMAVAAGMLLWTEPRLFFAVAWLAPILYGLNRVYRKKAAVAQQIAREGFARVSANLAENITGVRVVAAFHRQQTNLLTFNALQELNTQNNVQAARISAVFQPLLHGVGFVGRAIILLYGGYLVVHGSRDVGVGSVVASFLYWDWFMNPIVTLGTFHTQLITALAGAERIFSLLDAPAEIKDASDATPLPRIQGFVRFEGVGFEYEPGRPVLHDIEFEAPPGKMLALVGATGCGKSTVIALLARFYQPQHGRVLVDGRDIRSVTGQSLHRQMGLVLQTNFLFSGSVADNIRYARPDAKDAEVVEAAKRIGALDAISKLPHGIDTQVGERGIALSVGQRQIVCLARAYFADPRIFLLDEATSSIDTATELTIQHCLDKLLVGRTTIIVAHRFSTILRADLILVMDHGRIVERGVHHELRDSGGRYSEMYRHFAKSKTREEFDAAE